MMNEEKNRKINWVIFLFFDYAMHKDYNFILKNMKAENNVKQSLSVMKMNFFLTQTEVSDDQEREKYKKDCFT